ncbi:MAG: SRPBCC family protein [Deltaproteobacteria bacterium]|nr:SRPBCC family protein [Deltaproteobacteria bacterium]
MAKAKVQDVFDSPIDRVWGLIKDFGDISAWAPDAKVTKLNGKGVGMIRHVESEVGYFNERCEAYDDHSHSFSYSLVESPVPVKNYYATVTLTEKDADSCKIEWSSNFQPVNISEDEIVKLVEDAYGVFIENIKNALKSNG